MSKYTFNTMTGQVERKDEPAAGDVTEMTPEKLREFIENGCSARPEDKHDALVGVSAWEADRKRIEALKELVSAERDLPLKVEPNYEDPKYTEKHGRAALARKTANMPLPLPWAALAAKEPAHGGSPMTLREVMEQEEKPCPSE